MKIIKIDYIDNVIGIYLDDIKKIEILKNDLTLNADTIFKFLDYNVGDSYKLEPIDYNKYKSSEKDFLDPLYNVFDSLVIGINKISNEESFKRTSEEFEKSCTLD